MPDVRFTLLGPLRAWRGDGELALGARQQRLILALLLARAGEQVSVFDLVELVWVERPPSSAVNVVHRYVGALRRLLEPDLPRRGEGHWLAGGAGSYQLKVGAGSLDLLAFRQDVDRGRSQARSGRPEQALALFGSALALWRDRCAAGLDVAVDNHPTFVALENECTSVAREAARLAMDLGQPAAVLPALRRSAARNPFDEALQADLMRLLAADGKQADAIRLYQQVNRQLDDQLGVVAGTELQASLQAVLHGADSARDDEPAPKQAYAIRPAQLPSDHPYFTGRDDALDKLLGYARRRTESTVVLGIDGIPGVGKTTLGIHLAHRLAAEYPDGQLYADLRGFDGHRAPVDPGDVLLAFFSALGVVEPPGNAGVESRAALYRSVLADRRLLVMLDNAYAAEQIEPLLPGTPNCLVIVTSRTRLAPLAATIGANLLTLDTPGAEEARAGFVNRIGPDRARTEKAALDEIIERCGRLPLAMAVVAARAADQPLSTILSELREARLTLDAFADDNLDNDLRAIFSWSYRRLTPAAARLFRLLSLHPGPDITAPSASALAGTDGGRTRGLLAELLRTRLVTQHRPQRYRLHLLVRTYALELAQENDSRDTREVALHRLQDFYQDGADSANRLIEGSGQVPPLPRDAAESADGTPAMEWFLTEHDVLRAIVEDAVRRGEASRAWPLVLSMQLFYHRYCWWSEWRDVAQLALDAATAAGDVEGRAHMDRSVAGALFFLGHYDEALRHLRSALDLFDQAGMDPERAHVLMNLSRVLLTTGAYAEAIRSHRTAILLLRKHGLRTAEASALQVMANYLVTERPQAAESLARRAAEICTATGDVQGLAICDELLARSALTQGRLADALSFSQRGIDRLTGTHYRITQAEAFTTNGDILAASGRWDAAQEAWEKALTSFDDTRTKYALELVGRLRSARDRD
ncbi:AfsR/SARP family transcriptional regulator [Paractinoplanes maris]|uniref:AfsR/SARP family transcriptional regulator n=1 Tax=Paractinoplanes maris TaxID=1734446 RepID=UPI00202047D0|nr:BTAD domain-containing putative transcriptional regulator [Actinoplanes maris]